MKYKIKEEALNEFFELIEELEQLLTERIQDLHEVRGGMQARHAYLHYRDLLIDAKMFLRKNCKE